MKRGFEFLGLLLLLPLLVLSTKRSTYIYDYSLDYDINTLPGEAGKDYPALAEVPQNDFYCEGKLAGYYADPKFGCQVYHKCDIDQRKDSFLCSNGTVFNQKTFVCEWWYSVDCSQSEYYYNLNAQLYKKSYSNSLPSLYKDSQGIVYIHSSPISVSVPEPDLSHASYAKPQGDLLFNTFFKDIRRPILTVVSADELTSGKEYSVEDSNSASEEKPIIKRYKAKPVSTDGKVEVEQMDEESLEIYE